MALLSIHMRTRRPKCPAYPDGLRTASISHLSPTIGSFFTRPASAARPGASEEAPPRRVRRAHTSRGPCGFRNFRLDDDVLAFLVGDREDPDNAFGDVCTETTLKEKHRRVFKACVDYPQRPTHVVSLLELFSHILFVITILFILSYLLNVMRDISFYFCIYFIPFF